MKIRIIMPKLGLTMEQGTIVSWLKGEGDSVSPGEPLLEIETDKIIEEVAAEAAGTLVEIVKKEGETVPVGDAIGFIEGEDGKEGYDATSENASLIDRLLAQSRTAEKAAARREGTPAPRSSSDRLRISRRASNLAREKGVEASKILHGSGPGGRIVEKDVLAFLEKNTGKTPSDVLQPTSVQRIVAERLTVSFATIPHFYLSTEAAASGLLSLRKKLIPPIKEKTGIRVTLTDLFVRITAVALSRHPALNACWSEERIRILSEIGVGFAVDTPRGLLVPVLKNADQKSIAEIAQERSALVGRAMEGRLSREEVSGGSLTLSNLGMFGIDRFQPIINPPQSVILAIGSIAERPTVIEGKLGIRPTVALTMAVDHRVVGGAEGAKYLRHLADLVQDPESCFEER